MTEIIFELFVNLIETFLILEFVTKYLGSKYGDNKRIVGFLLTWLIAFAELSIVNHITIFESFATLIPVIIYFIYAVIFLNGSVLLKLWVSALIQIIVVAIAIITNLVICNLIGYDTNLLMSVLNSERIISIIISKIMLFYITRLILKNRYKNPIDRNSWLLLILIPTISIISLSALMLAAINHEEIKVYILIGMSCIVIANIITYYFFTVLNREYETKLRVNLLKQQNENAKKSIEDSGAFVKQMRSVKHDINNQMLIIYNYIDNQKYNEAKEYIKTLTDDYLPSFQENIETNSDAFDAIVNAKIAVCNQKKIYIQIRVMTDLLNKLDAIDTGVLFGNILDNAIEAAEKTKSRRISMDIEQKGAYLSILISNSINESVLEKNRGLETTKKEKSQHGIGIKSVKSIVKKYDGMISFDEINNEFCCHIMLIVK